MAVLLSPRHCTAPIYVNRNNDFRTNECLQRIGKFVGQKDRGERYHWVKFAFREKKSEIQFQIFRRICDREGECALFIISLCRYAALMRFLVCGRDAWAPGRRVTDIERAQYFFLSKIRPSSPMLYCANTVFSPFYDRLFGIYPRSRIYVAGFFSGRFSHGGISTWCGFDFSLARKKQPCIEGVHPSSRFFFHRKERRYKPLLESVLSARCYRRFILFFFIEDKDFNFYTSRSSSFYLRDWAVLFAHLRDHIVKYL